MNTSAVKAKSFKMAQDAALALYGLVQRTGVQRWPVSQTLYAALYFRYKKYFEDPFRRLMDDCPSIMANGDILDIGANIGYASALFAKAVSPGFQVYAFEPENINFDLLQRMIAREHLASVICPVQAAVGDREGTVQLWLNRAHPADHRVLTDTLREHQAQGLEVQPVVMHSVDSFLDGRLPRRKISFIKVDVQGFEGLVCLGMTRTLAMNPDAVVALEYYPQGIEALGFKAEEILVFFASRRYNLYVLTRAIGLKESSYENIAALVRTKGYVDLVFTTRKLD